MVNSEATIASISPAPFRRRFRRFFILGRRETGRHVRDEFV